MKNRQAKQFFEQALLISHEYAGAGAYCMSVQSDLMKAGTYRPRAGQFYMIALRDESRLLSRPISVHSYEPAKGIVRFLYRPVGGGTKELTQYRAGEKISIQGPLGNGFNIPSSGSYHLIAGGGIGLAPLVQLVQDIQSKNSRAQIVFFAGGRDKSLMELLSFFALPSEVTTIVCTDDGSAGVKGFVPSLFTDYLTQRAILLKDIAAVYACGPMPMLEQLAAFTVPAGIPCQISLEKRMACGVRACMGCSITTAAGIKKVCADGPVFDAGLITAQAALEKH